MGYGASLGDRCVIHGTQVALGNLVTVGADCQIGARALIGRSSMLGDGADIGQDVVMGVEVMAGVDLTLGERVRVRKGAVFADGVTVNERASVGRDAVIEEDATLGSESRLGANARVGARGVVSDDERIRRGGVVDGNPLDLIPPVIPGGQAFALTTPASAGVTVGQIIATDNDDDIVSYAITAGDAGGATPYFDLSATGLLTLTAAGADALRDDDATLTIEVADGSGNTASNTVQVTVTYTFVCEGADEWLGYADLVNGDRANLCLIYRNTATSPDRNYNVFTNPDVVTSCLSPTQFVEPYFRGATLGIRYGAVRYELSHTPPSSTTTSNTAPKEYRCNNGNCTSSALVSTASSGDRRSYVPSVQLCTISLDGYAIPTSSSITDRGSHTEFGSSTFGLYNRDMGGVQSGVETLNVTFYRATRHRNTNYGSGYTADAGYTFLQIDSQ